MTEHEFDLTSHERAAFDRDGFVGPFPGFLSDAEIDALRTELDELVVHRQPHPLYERFSVRDWHLVSPRVMKLFTHPAIVRRAVCLAGEDIVLWRSKVFHKGAGAGEIGWHQEWGWFNGEEIGNDQPGLVPARPNGTSWNLTVWVALDDISPENGPLQFVRGSHRTRYPIAMVPMTESAFFPDPFVGDPDNATIIERARHNQLVLDVDTSRIFDGLDPHGMDRAALRDHIVGALSKLAAAVTLPFDIPPAQLVMPTMRRGQFMIFTERTMHGSRPNTTTRSRIAINARITTSDTLVYPGRLRGDFRDGSNLDISRHRCVSLAGRKLNVANVYLDAPATPSRSPHALLGQRLPDLADAPKEARWESTLDLAHAPLIADHRVIGSAVVPGVTYLGMALAAVREARGWHDAHVEDVEYVHPLVLADSTPRRVQLVLGAGVREAGVRVFSRPVDGSARGNCTRR